MRNALVKTFARLRSDEKGVTLVEYGIAIALAITLGAGALAALGTDIGLSMDVARGQMITTAPPSTN